MSAEVVQMPNRLSGKVARRVRGLVAEAGINQREAADIIEVSQQGMSRRLTGTTPFTLDELEVLAERLDVSLAYMLCVSDTRSPRPAGPVGGSSEGVRRQGLEPRTRCFVHRLERVPSIVPEDAPQRGPAARVIPLRERRRPSAPASHGCEPA